MKWLGVEALGHVRLVVLMTDWNVVFQGERSRFFLFCQICYLSMSLERHEPGQSYIKSENRTKARWNRRETQVFSALSELPVLCAKLGWPLRYTKV